MKTLLVFTLGLFTSLAIAKDITYSNSADLSVNSIAHKLVDAEYVVLPTHTERQKVPNCTPNAESGEDCMRDVVIHSVGAIRANVSYKRSAHSESEGQEVSWLALNFKLTDFDAGEVEMLKSVYPRIKHPFTKAYKKFAARNLALKVKTVTHNIKVVDMAQSTICRTRQDGTKIPGCKEVLVYKDATSTVKNVTVSVK